MNPLQHEHLEDFTAHEWCNTLLSDPTITHISKRHIPVKLEGVANTFFTRTLFTSGAIRAYLTLHRAGKGATRDVDMTAIFTGGPSVNQTTHADKIEAEKARQLAKADIKYDITDPDAPESILLVSIGSDVDGGAKRLHGGVTASLLDQAMGTLLSCNYVSVSATSELKVKYYKGVDTPCVLKVRAKLLREKGRWVETWGSVEDGNGTVFAQGEGVFVLRKMAEAKI